MSNRSHFDVEYDEWKRLELIVAGFAFTKFSIHYFWTPEIWIIGNIMDCDIDIDK